MTTGRNRDRTPRDTRVRSPRQEGQRDELYMELSPRVSALASLAEMIEEFGTSNEIPQNSIFLINLQVDELLTNYVTHSLHKVTKARIHMTLRAFEERVTLEMLDSGPPFNPLQAAAPDTNLGVDEREVGGLGLHLVRTYSDRIGYECVEGCNRITIEHHLKPELLA